MRTFPLLLLSGLMLTVLPLPAADAYYCVADGGHDVGPRCCDTAGSYAIGSSPSARFYVDLRSVSNGALWIYQESNGVDGLQRGGLAFVGVNQQIHLNPIHTSQGSTPSYEDQLSSRWDGCFDELPGFARDTNLV